MNPRLVQYCVSRSSSGRTAAVGPPCTATYSGGRSSPGPVYEGLRGLYRSACELRPSADGKSSGSGVEISSTPTPSGPARGPGGASRSPARSRPRRARPVTDASVVGVDADRPPPSSPPARATARTSENGASRSFTVPSASLTASRSIPSRQYANTIRPPRSSAYREVPNTHCGTPISPSASSMTGSTSPSAGRLYKFHQPVRSEMKYSDPSGPHRGSDTDSAGPPATCISSPESRSRTFSRVPSQGMFGWSHSTQHSRRPSRLQRGLDTKSGPLTTTSGVRGSMRLQKDELVDDVDRAASVRWMVLAHADDPLAIRRHVAVGVPVTSGRRGLRGQRLGDPCARIPPVQTLVLPQREPHDAVAYPPGGTAVLVHGGAGVLSRCEQLRNPLVRVTPDQRRPPSLGGPALRPHHLVAVDADLAQPDRLRDDHLRGDRRRPRPVRHHPLLRHRPPP